MMYAIVKSGPTWHLKAVVGLELDSADSFAVETVDRTDTSVRRRFKGIRLEQLFDDEEDALVAFRTEFCACNGCAEAHAAGLPPRWQPAREDELR